MFSNYFKIAFRVLWRNKIYVILNVLGLGFAIACCILAYLNYNYRANFDKNHVNTQRIYRLNSTRLVDGNEQPWAVVPLPLAQVVQKELAGVARIARLSSAGVIVKHKDNTFKEHIYYADKTLFDFFTLPLKFGSLSGFDQPNQLVISDFFAQKYFSGQMPVGRSLTIVGSDGNPKLYVVTAVMQKVPANSSFQFDLVTSFENGLVSGKGDLSQWANPGFFSTFAELKDEKAARFITANLNSYAALLNRNRTDWPVKGFTLQPFSELAASSDIDMPGYVFGSQLTDNPRGVLVIVPAIMSLFILIITCFNFTNISIAFASRRLKEIGVRKVIGGLRSQLIRQFLTENIVLCLIASLLALLFVSILSPTVIELTHVDLSPDYGKDYGFWLFLLFIPIVCAVFSGLYPAVYISSFQPVRILKGKTSLGASNRFTRFLLIAQFSLSCFSLVVGIVMTQHASFQQKTDFGYSINELAVVEINSAQEYSVFNQTIQQNPDIKSVAGCTQQIGENTYTQTAKMPNGEIQAQVADIGGKDYLNTMGIRLVQGRHFYDSGADADESILVNETFLKQLGVSRPLGQRVTLDSTNYTIVGVVNDYKEYGLHDLVPPCVLRMARPSEYKFMVVRSNEDKLPQLAKYLQAAWHNISPNEPYRGFLQSDLIEKEIRMTRGFKSISFFLAIVTLLLSASGMFAQISLNIDKRSKEIGMRKVLGASVLQIIGLVNREFIRILLIAFVVGSVLGYLFTSKFIFQVIYKYHPDAGPEPYLGTFVIVLLCCGLIIGAKVFQAAKANPIERLRNE
ncbi:FtsX-like permease family protein [Dyadobacter frigoris]|uniref:FtsX-like permease family protein n=1 Tax=Dyadobacter frigoris TaxID=2576211 RepID=A0A4U6D683_9BACT|nr:FtsX-like permease family protein [Dyadobacter frigoris]TKT92852.1 FtsX-like permease family protein [Dyadobacter frigoris]GLU54379.1 ABC transporter permease [Dyadobacter frigoris]